MKYKILIASLATVLFSTAVNAELQSFRDRQITGIGVASSNGVSIFYVQLNGDLSSMTNCATTKRFAVNSQNPSYKEITALALAAYHSKDKKIDILATTSCASWSNSQDFIGIKSGDMPY